MKIWGILLLMLLSAQLHAQQVNGILLDKNTGYPVPGAVVKKGNSIQLTASNGSFVLTNAKSGDSVRVTLIGYKVYYFALGMPGRDTIRVYLTPNSIALRSVNIQALRDRKLDSLQNRREFASIFGYKQPTLYDIFTKVDPYAYSPNNYIMASNSTAALAGIDVLSAVALLTKHKAPTSKLHDLAVNQEQLNYVDERFSKQKITSITKLQGDSLTNFIYFYRPSIQALKQMKEYDLMVYIKKSYDDFKAGKNKVPVIK